LGCAYRAEHRNDMAEKFWLEALKYETAPKAISGHLGNLAALFLQEGQPERALKYAIEALEKDPANPKALANHGIACLELGRWKEGWEGWKYTHVTGDRPKRTYQGIPDWDGSPGKTVIVSGDQGIGDEIFFASALPDMQRVCKKVILDCHPRLPALFKRSFPEVEVYGTRKDLSDLPWFEGSGAEAAVMLSDLFSFFRNSDAEWGNGAAYLKAMPALFGRDKMRIGLSWTGGTKHTRTDLRSLPIEMLEPILQAKPDAEWVSLQYTADAARDVCFLEERTGIRISHFPSWVECYEYDNTASFVKSLNLVITVCTTIHHLGGALGVPTWTLVPSRPSWRYMVKGDKLPWYNSVRLFRQERDGDWRDPINRVAQELAAL
jgi:tetratricopeptide (TPR) repeat protein